MSKVITKKTLIECAEAVRKIVPEGMQFTIVINSFNDNGTLFSSNHISNSVNKDEVFVTGICVRAAYHKGKPMEKDTLKSFF